MGISKWQAFRHEELRLHDSQPILFQRSKETIAIHQSLLLPEPVVSAEVLG
jgi:hypothetical protein